MAASFRGEDEDVFEKDLHFSDRNLHSDCVFTQIFKIKTGGTFEDYNKTSTVSLQDPVQTRQSGTSGSSAATGR